MVNFFANSCNLSIWSELSNNIFVILGCSECFSLVDRLFRVLDDIFKTKRPKLIPFVLSRFQSHTMGIFTAHIIIFDVSCLLNWGLLNWGLTYLRWLLYMRSYSCCFCICCNCWLFSCRLSSGWNFPKIKFFEEMNFIVWINEFWEDFSIVTQVVY